MEMVRIHDLSAGYGGKVILKSIELSLKAGELVCLMGPNGSGKSTLLHTLAGILPLLAGKVECSVSGPREKTISVVLTDKSFHPDLTGLEMVAMGRYPHLNWLMQINSEDLTIIDSAIRRAGIDHLRDIRNQNMSDGQRQMVMIARALAQDTPILLLDEPTAHLDLNNRVEIMNLFRAMAHEEGKAVLLATHELDLALQTADRVWLSDGNGKIRAGVPEDMVLSGLIDEVFRLKGFTLKTGKVDRRIDGDRTIALRGDGYAYLWTKNAVERIGINVQDQADLVVHINEESGKINWRVKEREIGTVEELISMLKNE